MTVDPRLDRLLAGKDQLSVVEKEQILDQVLDRVARAERGAARPRWWGFPRWAAAAGVLAVAAPVALLLWVSTRGPEFTARGGAKAAPVFDPVCLGAGGDAGGCARGDKMLFKLSPGRFRAFAAVALGPDGTTFWYFPNDTLSTSVELVRSKSPGLLDLAIILDDRHTPGEYTLYGVFSMEPLTKEQVRQAIRESGGPVVAVVTRRLHVEERKSP